MEMTELRSGYVDDKGVLRHAGEKKMTGRQGPG